MAFRLALAGVLAAAALAAVPSASSAVPSVSSAVPSASSAAPGRQAVVDAAASYAASHGYRIGIAVVDTQTGDYYGAGDDTGYFASESVVKTMIATKLLATGQLRDHAIKVLAWKMITASDNHAATTLYNRVGRSALMDWIKRYYGLWGLGLPPTHPEHFGNNHISAHGLAYFYWHVKLDPKVGPWLMHAMRHTTRISADYSGRDRPPGADIPSDPSYQWWGIPSAASDWAVKQGWGCEDNTQVGWTCGDYADYNTTGYVNGDRHTMAILSRGPLSRGGAPIENMLTTVARILMPDGHFPDPPPYVSRLGKYAGRTRATNTITLYGWNFDRVRGVTFGGLASPKVTVVSPAEVRAVVPPHPAGFVRVFLTTDYGTSSDHPRTHYEYVPPPAVTTLSPSSGPTAGGTTVTVSGSDFRHVERVSFGAAAATFTVFSDGRLRATAPSHVAGRVDVRVSGWFGTSAGVTFTYR